MVKNQRNLQPDTSQTRNILFLCHGRIFDSSPAVARALTMLKRVSRADKLIFEWRSESQCVACDVNQTVCQKYGLNFGRKFLEVSRLASESSKTKLAIIRKML